MIAPITETPRNADSISKQKSIPVSGTDHLESLPAGMLRVFLRVRPTSSRFQPKSRIPPFNQKRSYSDYPWLNSKAVRTGFVAATAFGLTGGYYLWTQYKSKDGIVEYKFCPKYQKVYNRIACLLEDECYDDGSYGPIFVRLAWHSSGTYDKKDHSGGSNKATMRFEPESEYYANNGLHFARNRLEQVKEEFPWMSYGDIWTLAGVVGIQEMGGPQIPWRPGRVDGTEKDCPPDNRLPDGKKGTPAHSREIFSRMGFKDQEIVALIGAHTLGRCHLDRSKFSGIWTHSPTTFSNSYFIELLNRKWEERQGYGNKQFRDESGELMMLPTDMALLQDGKLKHWVEVYSKNEKLFFKHFARAFQKLVELGVPFKKGKHGILFKTFDEASGE